MSIGSEIQSHRIRDRVKEAYDRAAHRLIWEEMAYTHGVPPECLSSDGGGGGGCFFLFPDVRTNAKKIGQTNKTLKAATAAQSRLMSAMVAPELSGIDPIRRELIRQYWARRFTGTRDKLGGLEIACRSAWMEGFLHGYGCVELGVVNGQEGQRVYGRHIPATQVIWDPHARDPREATWVCFVKAVNPEEAAARWTAEQIKGLVRTQQVKGGTETRKHEYVLVATYYDLGIGNAEPTQAIFLGDIDKPAAEVKRNPFGFIPAAWMVHTLLPGMREPIGQVAMQRSSEMMIQQIIEAMTKKLNQPSFTFMATDSFTEESQELIRAGKTERVLELTKEADARTVSGITQPAIMDPVYMPLLNFFMQEFGELANFDETNRGGGARIERTKYEVAMSQAASEANRSGAVYGTMRYLQSMMEAVFRIGKDYDREPWTAIYNGRPIPMNDPKQPTSSLSVVLKDMPEVLVDQQALTAPDNQLKKQQEMSQLQQLAPYVGKLINPETFVRRMLDVLGISEADSWMQMPEVPQGTQEGLPGTPGDVIAGGQLSPEMIAAMAAG